MMEFTIACCLALFISVILLENNHAERQRSLRPQLIQILNQVVWDQYGPGNHEAFQKLYKDFPHIQQGDSRNVFPYADTLPFNWECGFAATNDITPLLISYKDYFENFASSLHTAVETGPDIPPPSEADSPEEKPINTSSHMKLLRIFAYQHWMRGDRPQAIQILADTLRYGQSFLASNDIYDQLTRMQILQYGLEGIANLIWNNPSVEDCRLMREQLAKLNPAEWSFPSYWGDPLWSHVSNLDRSFLPDLDAAFGFNYDQDDHTLQILQSIGIPVAYKNFSRINPLRSNSLFPCKWTTLPALRKRIQKLPPSFYENDPLFKPEQIKKIPPILYAASRLYEISSNKVDRYRGSFHLSFSEEMEKIKIRALALDSALWARQYREEHGVWPVSEEFQTQSPAGKTLIFAPIQNFRILALHLQKLFEPSQEDNNNHNPKKLQSVQYPNSHSIRFQCPAYIADRIHLENKVKVEIAWTLSIFQAASPLVQSATFDITDLSRGTVINNMGMEPEKTGTDDEGRPFNATIEYRLELNAPTYTYWILDRTEDSRPPDLILLDILTKEGTENHNLKKGKTVQLVGWE